MKLIRQLLAALLLVILLIACDQTDKRSNTAPITTPEMVESKKEPPPPPPAKNPQSQVTSHELMLVMPNYEETKITVEDMDGVADHGLDTKPTEFNTEEYDNIVENKFLTATQNPLSTFSIDVDEASYSNVRRYLENGSIPPAGAVRIEEMINYFDHDYYLP